MRGTFKNIFFWLVIVLMILPFLTTFSEQLTGILAKTPLYLLIQSYIVPYEIRVVGLILNMLHIPNEIGVNYINVATHVMNVSWNCLGWQSILFLIVSLVTGLQGQFKLASKVETAVLGIIGTFWVNIARILFIAILGGYFPSVFAVVFHDYFATLVTICWLFFFWWFSYTFVLEEKVRQ